MAPFSTDLIHLGMALALSVVQAVAPSDDAGVRAAIQAFADGAAQHDVSQLETALHPASVQFIMGPTLTRLERDAYLDLVRAKKLGGLPLRVDIQRVVITGRAAHADATFTSTAATLSHALSLVRAGDRWVIVSSVVAVVPK